MLTLYCIIASTFGVLLMNNILINAHFTTAISANDANWYQLITGKLTPNQVESLQTLIVYAAQRRAQAGEWVTCLMRSLV